MLTINKSATLALIGLLITHAVWALPSDFAGVKLGQDLEASKKFLLERGFNVIYPDGKIVWAKGEKSVKPAELKKTISEETKAGQLCTVTDEALLPKGERPAIRTFKCGVVQGKDPNPDRVIDTYIINHFLDEKDKGERAFFLTFMFNMKTVKPTGAGIVGKLGEPDSVTHGQPCPGFVKKQFKRAKNSCYIAMWLPDGGAMATVIGLGTNLRSGKVARLELWDIELQKKVENHKASKAANDLGF